MAQFLFQPVDASVLVWRQGEGTASAAPGSGRQERRFDVLADGVFVWGRRRSGAGSSNVTLSVADATHGHAVDNITLSASGVTALTVADAAHGHTVDGLTLTAGSVLAIQEALHAHAADNLTLDASGAPTLQVIDGLHAHTADGVALTVVAWLTVSDARHVHRADNLALTFVGPTVLSAPPSGHGPAMSARTTSAGRSRPAQLNSRTR